MSFIEKYIMRLSLVENCSDWQWWCFINNCQSSMLINIMFCWISAVVGLLYPLLDKHLGEPHMCKGEWSSVMRCVAVFVGINHASAVSFMSFYIKFIHQWSYNKNGFHQFIYNVNLKKCPPINSCPKGITIGLSTMSGCTSWFVESPDTENWC